MNRRFVGTVAALSVAWLLVPATWAAGQFDGEWKVTISTTEGRCPAHYVFPVTIQDNVIHGMMSGVKGRYEIKGRVGPDGRFRWGWGASTGTLSEKEGTGRWALTAGVRNDNCAGDIVLQRER